MVELTGSERKSSPVAGQSQEESCPQAWVAITKERRGILQRDIEASQRQPWKGLCGSCERATDTTHPCVGASLPSSLQKVYSGTSLAVQRLRLHLPVQGVQVRSLVRELRSHMPLGQKNQSIKQKHCCNKFNKG